MYLQSVGITDTQLQELVKVWNMKGCGNSLQNKERVQR